MKKNDSLLKMVLVMFVLAVVTALVLSFVHLLTKDAIEESNKAKELDAIKEVLPLDFDNNPFEEKTYIGEDKLELYPARKDGNINAVAIKTYSDEGFGGRVVLIVGFYLDGKISDYKIIEHKETPGLGTKVMEPAFKDQFKGRSPDKGGIRLKQDGGDVDAVTSATISSRSVAKAIEKAYEAYSNR